MSDSMRDPLQTVVVAMPGPEDKQRTLREAFPEIDFRFVEPDALEHEIADADAVVTWRISEAALSQAQRLRWVHRAAAGVEDLVTPALRERDIVLTNSSGVTAINISEHVMAMMLAFARGLVPIVHSQPEHRWNKDDWPVFELHGQTVALIGVGDIGENVARRAKAFGMSTIGLRRRADEPRPDGFDTMLGMDRLHEGLAGADHVVSSLPMTESTRAIIDADAIAAMKPGAYFYNVGRGGTVDQDALIAALHSGALAGAGLDVTSPEPLPADAPLWDAPNVLITSHTSGRTPHQWDRIFDLIHANLRRYRSGDDLLNVVDLDAGY